MAAMTTGTALTRGTLAGLAGTATMTAAQAVEMRLTGREASMVPGQVAGRLLGRKPTPALSHGMHWAHGVTGGVVRGLLGRAGMSGAPAAAAQFAGVWAMDATLYKVLGIAPAPWKWAGGDLAVDLFHKGLHAAATGAAFDRLTR